MSDATQFNEGYKHAQELLSMIYMQEVGEKFDFSTNTFYNYVVGMTRMDSAGVQIILRDNCTYAFRKGAKEALDDLALAADMFRNRDTAKVVDTINILF